ncbi:MAG TPA: hypothetical protein VFW22_07925 [Pseudolabrys sp.]|nr:hypothetical protein [Pseudolabrys sp.]
MRAKFRQVDVARALRATKASGLEIARVEINADGKIVVICGAPEPTRRPSALDLWKAEREMENIPGRAAYEKWKSDQAAEKASEAWKAKAEAQKRKAEARKLRKGFSKPLATYS